MASAGDSKHDVAFEFRECSVTMMPSTCSTFTGGASSPKTILYGVDGTVTSRNVLGTMGPSGAGKTTLINLLSAARASPGESRSVDIRFNGHPFSSSSECPVDSGTGTHAPVLIRSSDVVLVFLPHRQFMHRIAWSSSSKNRPGRG